MVHFYANNRFMQIAGMRLFNRIVIRILIVIRKWNSENRDN